MDDKIEALIGSLIHNEKEIADLRQEAAGLSKSPAESSATFEKSLQRLMDVHRETEAKLQVLISNIERSGE